jgi:hypothetical protein
MDWNRLQGLHYVRLAPGTAERVAPYLGVAAGEIDELVLDLPLWPREVRPIPRKGWNGQLIAGDPLLLDATDAGLVLAGAGGEEAGVLVPWEDVRTVQAVGGPAKRADA